jgi:D-arabinose 1-dehydrogenase-like Zn-dependent alcohol dehydrogenase
MSRAWVPSWSKESQRRCRAAESGWRGQARRLARAPLVVEDVERLGLEPGQIRVKVEASGLCHTDIHAAHGDWPVKPSPPFVPGHEGVGIVDELGPGVTEVAIGDRVAMPWLGYACGSCDYCVSGWETPNCLPISWQNGV